MNFDKIIDQIPEPDGGFRRRLTAGTIVAAAMVWGASGEIDLPELYRNIVGQFESGKAGFAAKTVFLFLALFAIGRFVELFAETFMQRLLGRTYWLLGQSRSALLGSLRLALKMQLNEPDHVPPSRPEPTGQNYWIKNKFHGCPYLDAESSQVFPDLSSNKGREISGQIYQLHGEPESMRWTLARLLAPKFNVAWELIKERIPASQRSWIRRRERAVADVLSMTTAFYIALLAVSIISLYRLASGNLEFNIFPVDWPRHTKVVILGLSYLTTILAILPFIFVPFLRAKREMLLVGVTLAMDHNKGVLLPAVRAEPTQARRRPPAAKKIAS